MPTPQRLPIVNSDDGTWGDILRQYLMKEHVNDDTDNSANGGHKKITIQPGTASAGTAPLKFTSGTLLTAPEAGAIEFNTDKLYFTQTTGTTRRTIAAYDDSAGATGDIYYRNGSGSFTRLGVGSTGDFLTVSSGIPAWSPTIPNTSTITLKDANFTLQDDIDTTKQLKFQLSGISTATTRTFTVPDADTTLVGTNVAQTLSSKTLSSGTLSGTTIIPATGILESYNTADQTTNTEKLIGQWISNTYEISTYFSGSGTSGRSLRLGIASTAGATAGRSFIINNSGPFFQFSTSTSNATSIVSIANGNTWSASSGAQNGLLINPTINQSGTASYTGLLINPTETATGSGSKLLADFQVGGVSKFKVDNTGVLTQSSTLTATSGTLLGASFQLIADPAATSSSLYRAFNMSTAVLTTNAQTFSNTLYGGWMETRIQGTGSYAAIVGASGSNIIPAAAQSFGTITTAWGINGQGVSEFASGAITGTVTTAVSINAQASATSRITVGTAIGVDVAAQTVGGTNIGVRIAKSNTYSLQLTDTGGTTAGGITFGTDTNLYRSAASTLRTSGNLIIATPGTATGSAVTIDGTQTLTNKTISGVDNTIINIAVSSISATGTPSATTYLRGDGSWATVSGGTGTDANGNLSANSFLAGFTSTASAAGTTILTITSTPIQVITGTTTQTVRLPTTSVPAGAQYTIINNSTGLVTVQSSGAATILTMVAGTSAIFTAVVATPTTAANWNSQYIGVSISTGKRLAVSNTLTLAGTDNTTMTFPSTSDTVVTLGATQKLTAKTLTLPTINGYNEGTTTATVTTSYTFSLASTTQFILTLTANTTCNCTMPAASSGGSFTVQVKQPAATGNGGITFLNTKWPTAGMPAPTSAAGKMDIFSFVSDGTSWFGSYVQGYTY